MTKAIEETIADLRQALTEDPSQSWIEAGLEGLPGVTDTVAIDGHINLRFIAEWLRASGYRKTYKSRARTAVAMDAMARR